MRCVAGKTEEVEPARVQAESEAGSDRLPVTVQAAACRACGEPHYSAEVLGRLGRVRGDFPSRAIAPPSVGRVDQVS